MPGMDAVMVAVPMRLLRVVILNVVELCPCGTVTEAGTKAIAELLNSVTVVGAEAGPVSVMVPTAEFPPITGLGTMLSAESVAAVCGLTVS